MKATGLARLDPTFLAFRTQSLNAHLRGQPVRANVVLPRRYEMAYE